ncbi:Coenzyme F420 hydrogenase/dehydrogenase, beta subunit C-terminal domain [Butyrivibrio sp. DSM 10294]|uniref:Coenzyme F420 hydrogenase/dehydrogenase, beta subunit C-terminal domain n=1 Tax=Butyrivibrio sp. DSM 10294 TaxID=2972457 RepID=UPI00234F1A55|nr:Coenzyme F420 hydrogenase/dehydrogenase, beta subunit C-terminal domain [Butyrivibrio sp. DSM 10294]MDC7294803.1 Coenzyme F420 hydrogenase/dehydrogenase, beta subunit C-terminal domain [Butyrivibrio sp. DSM 10294]
MISLAKKDCCGCETCAQVCPRNCIEMVADKEGFKYPVIDKKKCVDCHLCEKCCPSLNKMNKVDAEEDTSKTDCYVARNQSTERLNSSSGGIFVLLAKKILSEGGVVFGAAFDSNWRVQQTECIDISDLDKLMRSKYVQSANNDSYKKAKEYLQAGRKVLYTGTACQIEGLKAFLGREYDNLFTADVLCHGVPSPKVWDLYVKELMAGHSSKISSINFRDKSLGWHDYSFKATFEDGSELSREYFRDPYMLLFIQNVILRPSCHFCKFKGFPRCSDITLGDAWGIEKKKPEMDDDKGTSVIICNSDKGMNLLEEIEDGLEIHKGELDVYLPKTAHSRIPVPIAKERRICFIYLTHGGDMAKLRSTMNSTFKSKVLRNLLKSNL